MSDERDEAAPALSGKRANWVVSCEVNDAGNLITYRVRGVEEVLTLDVEAMSASNRRRAAIHGMRQRISDAAAISRDPTTGRPATPADKHANMKRLVDHYMSGSEEWSLRAAGGGAARREIGNTALLREALAIYREDKSAEEIAEFVKSLSRSQVTGLLASADLADAVALVRERYAEATPQVDAEELLQGL